MHTKRLIQGGAVGAALLLALSIWWFTRGSPRLFAPDTSAVVRDNVNRTHSEERHGPSPASRQKSAMVVEFQTSLDGLGQQERNQRIVAKLMDAEHLRLKSITGEERKDEFVSILELNPLSPGELKDLIAIAALAEGGVEESGLPFAVNATKGRPLTDFLLEVFRLWPGTGPTTVSLHFHHSRADKVSYDTSTTFPGTRTRKIGGGSREPLVAGWRFDRFFEPIGEPAGGGTAPLPPAPRQTD